MFIKEALSGAKETLDTFLSNSENINHIEQAIKLMVDSLNSEGRLLACGNGGSMCDSQHFAEELTGRYRKDRKPLAAHSMGEAGHMTCVANDFGFDHVFERNVEAWGRSGDTLLAISTSGNSANVLLAAKKAKSLGINVVGLSGKGGGELKDIADVSILVESDITDRIQEVHIKVIHVLIEGIERQLFPELYA